MTGEWTARGVRAGFDRWQAAEPELARVLDDEARAYVDYHAARYARLLSVVDQLVAETRPPDRLRILDVGPNIQTALLRHAHPTALVDTLGFAHPAVPPRADERHIEFDLNDAQFPERDPQPGPAYDLVTMAEVVEHLYTPLTIVLARISGWLRPPGFVVIQTPNGAALHKRLRLLFGRSPVEPPRPSRENPGHFHEYTVAELRAQVAASGMLVVGIELANHFGGASVAARLYRDLGRLLPPTMRHGVTLCARAAP